MNVAMRSDRRNADMIEIVSLIVGFLSPFLPEVIKLFQGQQDNKHELAMLRERLSARYTEREFDMEAERERTDRQELIVTNAPKPSYAVGLVKAGAGTVARWALYPAFLMFAFIDAMNQAVRPLIALTAFSAYVWVKYAEYLIYVESEGSERAIIFTWNENDLAILLMILGHYFGNRVARHAFGSRQ